MPTSPDLTTTSPATPDLAPTSQPPAAEPRGPGRISRAATWATRFGIMLALVVLCVGLSFASPYFLTRGNIINVLRQTSINGILALGMTLVIISGGIDLSVGSILAFAGMVAASLATRMNDHTPANLALVVGAALLAGLGIGLVNGFVVAKLAIPPFVVTLGMLSVARGLTYIYSDGQPIPNLGGTFLDLGRGLVFGVPVPVLIFAAVVALSWLVLAKTSFGRYVYAVGGNERSALTSGIRTKRIILAVYVISGLLAALGGVILTARTTSGLPQAGVAYELDAIAAVVIGGTSLSGGIGSPVGSMLGALIIGVINNGLDLLGVSSYYQQVIKGAIIVLAVLLDPSRRSRE